MKYTENDFVWEIQRFLSLMGFYIPSRIDGLYGNETLKSLQMCKEVHSSLCVKEELSLDELMNLYQTMQSILQQYAPSVTRNQTTIVDDIDRIGSLMGLTDQMKAYVLATIQHETAGKMSPVEEVFYLPSPKREAVQRGFDYYPYFGRGDVQFNWKANYEWLSKLFSPVTSYVDGKLTDVQTNFLLHPENMLNPQISLIATLVGMKLGLFRRNHLLERYFNELGDDAFNARLIINGMVDGQPDKADLIESYYKVWLKTISNKKLQGRT
jgi:hypothetical protein